MQVLKYCPSCGSPIGINDRCSSCVKHSILNKYYQPKTYEVRHVNKEFFKEAEEFIAKKRSLQKDCPKYWAHFFLELTLLTNLGLFLVAIVVTLTGILLFY